MVAARDLARRLDRLAPKARPVFIWINSEDTQEDIAARVAQLEPAERRNVQLIGWEGDLCPAQGRKIAGEEISGGDVDSQS